MAAGMAREQGGAKQVGKADEEARQRKESRRQGGSRGKQVSREMNQGLRGDQEDGDHREEHPGQTLRQVRTLKARQDRREEGRDWNEGRKE